MILHYDATVSLYWWRHLWDHWKHLASTSGKYTCLPPLNLSPCWITEKSKWWTNSLSIYIYISMTKLHKFWILFCCIILENTIILGHDGLVMEKCGHNGHMNIYWYTTITFCHMSCPSHSSTFHNPPIFTTHPATKTHTSSSSFCHGTIHGTIHPLELHHRAKPPPPQGPLIVHVSPTWRGACQPSCLGKGETWQTCQGHRV